MKIDPFLKSVSLTTIIKVIGFGFNYLFLLTIAKLFGPEGNGEFAISSLVLFITVILSRLGLDTALVKKIAICDNENKDNRVIIYLRAIILTLIASSLSLLILWYLSPYLAGFIKKPTLVTSLKIVAFTIPLLTILDLNGAVLRGLGKTNLYALFAFGIRHFSSLIFLVLLFYYGQKGLYITTLSFAVGLFILFSISSFFVVKELNIFGSKISKIFNLQEIKSLLKLSIPMLFASSLIFIMGWVDTLFATYYFSQDKVGIYNIVIKMSVLVNFTINAINASAAPKIAHLYYANKMQDLQNLIRKSTSLSLYTAIPVYLFIIIFTKPILSFFGNEYIIGSTALIFLASGKLINAVTGTLGYLMQMSGHERVFQNILILTLFINIALNSILVGPYGLNGLAIASMISLFVWSLSIYLFVFKKMKFNIF